MAKSLQERIDELRGRHIELNKEYGALPERFFPGINWGGSHYNHMGNLTAVQFGLEFVASYPDDETSGNLVIEIHDNLVALETYLDLIEKHPGYREFELHTTEGAYPDLRNIDNYHIRYVGVSEERLKDEKPDERPISL